MKPAFDLITHWLQDHFGGANRHSPVILLKDRAATQLNVIERRIGMYLQALWGWDFIIRPIVGQTDLHVQGTPYVEDFLIYLPSSIYDRALDDKTSISGLETYRAAATHAAAHIIFSRHHFLDKPFGKSLDKLQMAVISTIEDARVETLSIRQFPGLKNLWRSQHGASPMHKETAGDYLDRLALALLDETYQDDDHWVRQGRALFNAADNLDTNDVSRDIGLTLARSFLQKKIRFNNRTDKLSAAYRDDNRFLWKPSNLAPIVEEEGPKIEAPVKLFLDSNNVANSDEEVHPPPMHMPILAAPASDTYVYPEWDYRGQIQTASWVTVRERDPEPGDLNVIENIITRNKHLISRMNHLLQALQYKGAHRHRRLEDGDEIDINAAIRTQVHIRLGMPPDTRVMMSSLRRNRDISVLVLLDLSHSTNQKVHGQEHTVLQLTQEVCILFAEALETIGDSLAIYGFNSRGRHDVDYFRFKHFGQPYDSETKARIAGMSGKRSTRIGAAIRHSTHHLNQQKSAKKLLMIITDGKPYDLDQPDPRYLCFDGKHAVIDAGRNGIHSYCISLDPEADEYITRIFGTKNYIVVDHIHSLPEKMLHIYAALSQ
jgi:nitric oxide reductase NorD protein